MKRELPVLVEIKQAGPDTSVKFRFGDVQPSDTEIRNFFRIEDLIKTCVINAEAINTSFRNFVTSVVCAGDHNARSEAERLDFMNLKDRFIEWLKKKKEIKDKIPLIDNDVKFKAMRRNFQSFITDRNIYTHGKLTLFRPSGEYVIQYKDNNHIPVFAIIDVAIVTSYNRYYAILRQFLSDVNGARPKRR